MNCTINAHQPSPSKKRQPSTLMLVVLLLSLPQFARSSSFIEGEFGLHGITQLTALLLLILLTSKIEMGNHERWETKALPLLAILIACYTILEVGIFCIRSKRFWYSGIHDEIYFLEQGIYFTIICTSYLEAVKRSRLNQSFRNTWKGGKQPTQSFIALLFAVSALLHFAGTEFSLLIEGVRASNGFKVEASEIAKLTFQLLAMFCMLVPVFRTISQRSSLGRPLLALVAGSIAGIMASRLVNPESSALILGACSLLPTLTAILLSILSSKNHEMNPTGIKSDNSLKTPQPPSRLNLIPASSSLSDREKEVLELTLQGRTSAEIGNLLGLSIPTVSTYRSRGYKKLQVSSKQELLQVTADSTASITACTPLSGATETNTETSHQMVRFDTKLLLMMITFMVLLPLLPPSLAHAGSIASTLALLAFGTITLQACRKPLSIGETKQRNVELLGIRSLICGCILALSQNYIINHSFFDTNSMKFDLILLCVGMAFMRIYSWLSEVEYIKNSACLNTREMTATRKQIQALFKGMGFDTVTQDVIIDSLAGASASTIAASRLISKATVYAKMQQVYARLDVHSHAELSSLVNKLIGKEAHF